MTLSRRSMLQLGGVSLAAGALVGAGESRAASQLGATVLDQFDYGDVALMDGPAFDQFQDTHKTLLALDEDALLKPFREKAGLPAPGPDFGGWYNASPRFNPPGDMSGYIPGHSFGQHLSALSRAYAVTGDAATGAKVRRLVAGYAPTIASRFYDGYPLPAYTFDKTAIGLIDAHSFGRDPSALHVLNAATDAALPRLPEKALTRPEMEARPHANVACTWDESYTLPENLYLAWSRGAGDRYRALASRYLLDQSYFDPLAAGRNVLPGKHAYSHLNALNSAMQAYLVDGSAKHLKAARNGFDFIRAQSFATGGWGPNEGFIEPGSGALGDSLNTTHAGFEAPCGAYGHFKLTRYLMRATGDSRYGDSMEQVFYNTVLGALPMKPDGTGFYYADYNNQGAKIYFEYKCPCCFGTLGQVAADYGISSYFHDERGISVNLYLPSRVNWRRGGRDVSLTQRTLYPLASEVLIEVETPKPETFAVRLRIPAWAGADTRVTVNGAAVTGDLRPGRFFEIQRTWRGGDRIALRIDRSIRLEAVDDQHPNVMALRLGPLALFATGDRFLPFTRAELLNVRQQAPGASTYWVTTGGGRQSFQPYFAIGEVSTRLYQPLIVST
jgi:DUF1680 family protein